MVKSLYPLIRNGNSLRSYVPIKIINPFSGIWTNQRALLDSGADGCVFPNFITKRLNSYTCGERGTTKGVNGSPIETEPHLLIIYLLDQSESNILWKSDAIEIACLLHDEIPPLMGTSDFLSNFDVTFNYKNGSNVVIEI